MEIDLEELACVVDLLKTAEFSEFRYEKGDVRLIVRRGSLRQQSLEADAPAYAGVPTVQAPLTTVQSAGTAPAPAVPLQPAELVAGTVQVTAPLLGSFYGRPKPGEAPFVKVGDRVEPDTVMCIVEVMKLMNSVSAGCAGVVAAIHAADNQLVEFGQTLFSIVPDAS